jgi:hypothetical protein
MMEKKRGAGGKDQQGAVRRAPQGAATREPQGAGGRDLQSAANSGWGKFISPFEKVAGWTALAWGLAGLAVSAVVSAFSGWQANGLLQFGPGAPETAWWVPVLTDLIIWLGPALLFYGLGAALSR